MKTLPDVVTQKSKWMNLKYLQDYFTFSHFTCTCKLEYHSATWPALSLIPSNCAGVCSTQLVFNECLIKKLPYGKTQGKSSENSKSKWGELLLREHLPLLHNTQLS